MPLFAELLAGSGLGLLVGFLMGLSVAQVVGGAITVLGALLGGFFGLSKVEGTERTFRIGAFGFACVLGVALGLAVRSGALLAPSVAEDVARWTSAGYSPDQARAFVAFQRLGVKPEGSALAEPPKPGAGSNALFAEEVRGVCNQLVGLSPADQIALLKAKGGRYGEWAASAANTADPARALQEALKCGP